MRALLIIVLLSLNVVAEKLDLVIAAIDDEPILLSEIRSRYNNPKISLEDLKNSEQGKAAFDNYILERLIQIEAKSKGLSASTGDIENYLNQVAAQNGLSREDFEKALANQGKSLEQYKKEIESEILKGKLLSGELRRSIVVTDAEALSILRKSRGISPSPIETITLSQVAISKAGRSKEEIMGKVSAVQEQLKDSSFEDVASKLAEDVTSLGTFDETSLSKEIFDAVGHLNAGELSMPLETADKVLLYYVESRSRALKNDEFTKEEIEKARNFLRDRKLELKMSTYVTDDLTKKHSIDKKI
jgi:parvulin-like peptidyl-prolyl isomerase